MENKTVESNDQAAELRKLLDEVDSGHGQDIPEKVNQQKSDTDTEPNVDILNLPPRKDVHSNHNKRTKLKIAGASKRLLSLVLILILLFGASSYLWGEELLEIIRNM